MTIVDSQFVDNSVNCFRSAGGAVVANVIHCNSTQFEANVAIWLSDDAASASTVHARGGAFSLPFIDRMQLFNDGYHVVFSAQCDGDFTLLSFSDCVFVRNEAFSGGGIAVSESKCALTLVIADSSFLSNRASQGSAMYVVVVVIICCLLCVSSIYGFFLFFCAVSQTQIE